MFMSSKFMQNATMANTESSRDAEKTYVDQVVKKPL